MKLNDVEIEGNLRKKMDTIRDVPGMDPDLIAQERQKFLAHGKIFREAVSAAPPLRHNSWIDQWIQSLKRKEFKPMFTTVMTIFVTLSLLFGGAGASVAAAQDDLPGEPLYALKRWTEEVRARVNISDQEQLQWMLELTNRRMEEIKALSAQGKPIPEPVALRLEQHQETALRLAAGLQDEQMIQALVRIRQQSELHLRTMQDVMAKGSGNEDPILLRIRDRLQEQLHLCDEGINEPDLLRVRLQTRDQDRTNWPFGDPESTPGYQNQTGPGGAQDPNGESYGPGPDAQGPADDPGSYGPGPQAGTATPPKAGPGPNQPTTTPQNGEPGPKQPTATPQQGEPGPKQPTVTPQQGEPGPKEPTATPNGASGSEQPTNPGNPGKKP